MRDITAEMRTQDFQRALRQYGQLFQALGEIYEERASDADDLMTKAGLRGSAETAELLGDVLISASAWDSPDRPITAADIREAIFKDKV